ncbi:BolA family protein [Polynucleobacter asymbioticus]|uniref:Transcriptional regulator, BolA protein family n=1 Tax=Polynucleobacter asymbioticus (strain DSM 18221 / CIP 109841 / QLW-P1DMWA-1) TaxID=312153 RepID=A4SXH6_POLAQ|nr:BolA family protein [Polynucleobacter asymbioticus]ABP34190.1 transcriptional regulator, BolA protein family [Polynucleobacter asymbioticus QLW-P1DMWA-1]
MNINQQRIALFEKDLHESFEIEHLIIDDESHLHAGHAGAASGGGHFKVAIVSPAFKGIHLVGRHRAIYAALHKHIPKEIHALTILAYAPGEYLA